jgi:hypothetical protein
MIVTVDGEGAVALAEPDVFDRFHVAAPGLSVDGVLGVLGSDAKPAEEGHLWLSIERLHRLGETHGSGDWRKGCDGMLRYAASKGWIDADERFVLAHIEA